MEPDERNEPCRSQMLAAIPMMRGAYNFMINFPVVTMTMQPHNLRSRVDGQPNLPIWVQMQDFMMKRWMNTLKQITLSQLWRVAK